MQYAPNRHKTFMRSGLEQRQCAPKRTRWNYTLNRSEKKRIIEKESWT